MTIRQKKIKSQTVEGPKPNVFFDDKVRSIVENMTARYARILGDFIENRRHPAPCICWLCLWRKYEEDKPVGHPFDFLTFLARDIISEAEDPFQDEGIKNIPAKKLTREVIRRLPLFSPETKAVLRDHAWQLFEEHFKIYSRRKRYDKQRFLKIIAQLEYLRYREWKRSKPKPVSRINLNKKYQTEGQIALGIANFVYSKPGRKATQRDLLRYLNKHKADIEYLHEYLKAFYGIEVGTEGRSIIYFARRKPNRYLRIALRT